ncbi:MAG: carboxypeptidase regulatory-like domain-containing protein [Salinibacter sp.]
MDQRLQLSLLVFAIAVFLTAGVSPAIGQKTQREAVVQGFVRAASDGHALQGANAVLRDTTGRIESAAAANAGGFYQIASVTPGRYHFTISFVGYQTYRDTIRLAPGERRTVTVSLKSADRQLEGVVVQGRQPVKEAEAGLRKIESADIKAIPTPGPGSDLSSYLRGLPSVTTTGDRGGRLYVRGGTPSQNLVLVDGIPLYKPFHIIGFYSAFPGDMVSSTNFYAGGFGAEYMGRISSVLDIQLRSGNTEHYEGMIGAGPFLASAQFEGPLLQGSSSILVHARHSVIEHTGPTVLGQKAPYKFYDVTAKIHTQAESSQCSFVGLRTYDRGRIDPNRAAAFRWHNTALGGQCLIFGGSSAQVLDVSFGTTRFGNAVLSTDGTERSASTWRIYTNFDLTQPVLWGNPLRWSIKARVDKYKYGLEEPFLGVQTQNRFLLTTSTHLGAEFTWNDRLTVNPSIGAQFPISLGGTSIEPRLHLSYRPGGSERMKLTAAGGLYRQYIVGLTDERDAGSTFQVLVPTPFRDRPSQAVHALLGWDQRLWQQVHLSLEGWYKQLRNLPVPQWSSIVRFNTNLVQADGRAYGADLTLQYNQGPLRLGASYGYSRVRYRAPVWSGDPTTVEFPPPHDLRHKIGLTASLSTDWFTASARWQYSSGRPFTSVYGYDTMLEVRGLRDTPFEDVGTPRAFFKKAYGARLPPYHRLDISLKRTIDVSPSVGLSVEGGAINAYDRANVFYIDIFTLDRVNQLPLIPYLSLKINLR